MLPIQKATQVYNLTMNLSTRGRSFSKKDLVESTAVDKQDELEMKKKFDFILQKAMQRN